MISDTIKVNIDLAIENIVGEGDDIKLIAAPELIADIKDKYGIDLENNKLLNILKEHRTVSVRARSAVNIAFDKSPAYTDEELDKQDAKELEAAKAAFKKAYGKDLPKQPSYSDEELVAVKEEMKRVYGKDIDE